MKLRIFQSDKGDCLLLSSADGKHVLVDGGMRESYLEHVAPNLTDIEKLDLVYVSHIDRDHISGVLQLMKDVLAWHVFDLQSKHGSSMKEPPGARPPKVEHIWHNAFHDQVDQNVGDIEEALTASGVILEGAGLMSGVDTDFLRAAELRRGLATSVSEGIELSKRAHLEPLGIKINADFDGDLAMVRDKPQKVELGSVQFTVIGPFKEDLDKLREEWNEWLEKNGPAVKRLREKMGRDAARLTTGELSGFEDAVEASALALDSEVHDDKDRKLGDRSKVTVPNLASLMVLAEEDGKRLLLTGDGSQKDILKGLDAAGRLDDGRIHVEVLKVQHHGSEHNIDRDFCERVTADHYVFCANGEHENPDLDALTVLLEARKEDRLKLWFNSSAKAAKRSGDEDHMQEVEDLVSERAQASGGRVEFEFLSDASFFDLPV
jgi:L-ascorbate metabolism protein UlaG (beta-lactamase superfamily)